MEDPDETEIRLEAEIDHPSQHQYYFHMLYTMDQRHILSTLLVSREQWKRRFSPAGVHLFNRVNGLNILLDEVDVPASMYSRAPRQVSIALTNRCDLTCPHCYAPKTRDELSFDKLIRWLGELDENGTLGIGFGGGEPTLFPEFTKLCRHTATHTSLAVSFTTHGHHIDKSMADELQGSIHFIRVSMDGVGGIYESIRRRSFQNLLTRMKIVRTIANFGINFVVNERTLEDLDMAVAIGADLGCSELLLLPQMATRNCTEVDNATLHGLRRWVEKYQGTLKLSINEGYAEGFPTCDPIVSERGLHAYAHIDALGVLKPSSFTENGVQIGEGSVLQAIEQLTHELKENDI